MDVNLLILIRKKCIFVWYYSLLFNVLLSCFRKFGLSCHKGNHFHVLFLFLIKKIKIKRFKSEINSFCKWALYNVRTYPPSSTSTNLETGKKLICDKTHERIGETHLRLSVTLGFSAQCSCYVSRYVLTIYLYPGPFVSFWLVQTWSNCTL
jgi:hypothetical protein